MREIYLDNAATTPVDPQAARLAARVMEEYYGNPSSLHKKGLEAQLLLEKAREQLARALDCLPEEITFTSGATEANNLAIQGGFAARRRRGNALVAGSAEHSSVRAPIRMLAEAHGAQAAFIDPGPEGSVDPRELAQAVTQQTVLLSCGMVNSETGAVTDLPELIRLAKKQNPRVLIHTDAVQAFGKRSFSLKRLGVDFASVSGHKLHAPKGIGALYIKKGLLIPPLIYGGGQERGLRPGTESVPLACAFGLAAESAREKLEENLGLITQLREHFVKRALQFPGMCINMPLDGAPNICNVSIPGYRSETMIHFLAQRGIYVSGGSACAKGADSHVLAAMGLPRARIKSALRVSLSPRNTLSDLDELFSALEQGVNAITRSSD